EVPQPADDVHSEEVQHHDGNGEPDKPENDLHEPRAARGVVERKSGGRFGGGRHARMIPRQRGGKKLPFSSSVTPPAQGATNDLGNRAVRPMNSARPKRIMRSCIRFWRSRPGGATAGGGRATPSLW